jgi:co-chaperonin GroES (HSP10)
MENGASVKHEPKFGRVLIKREVKTKTTGGIIIPDNAAKRNARCEGVIVALGETAGWTEVPEKGWVQTLNIGDTVIFGRHAGAWLDGTDEKDDGTLYICQDQDILTRIAS